MDRKPQCSLCRQGILGCSECLITILEVGERDEVSDLVSDAWGCCAGLRWRKPLGVGGDDTSRVLNNDLQEE